MSANFTPRDEGKRIVTGDGELVGFVARVRDGEAFVSPAPPLLAGYGSWLSCPWEKCEPFHLDGRQVSAVTDDAIILKSTVVESRAVPNRP